MKKKHKSISKVVIMVFSSLPLAVMTFSISLKLCVFAFSDTELIFSNWIVFFFKVIFTGLISGGLFSYVLLKLAFNHGVITAKRGSFIYYFSYIILIPYCFFVQYIFAIAFLYSSFSNLPYGRDSMMKNDSYDFLNQFDESYYNYILIGFIFGIIFFLRKEIKREIKKL